MLNGVMIPQHGSLFLSFSGTCRGWPIQHFSLSGHFCVLFITLSLKEVVGIITVLGPDYLSEVGLIKNPFRFHEKHS